jgi:FAD:protein FMN transferase
MNVTLFLVLLTALAGAPDWASRSGKVMSTRLDVVLPSSQLEHAALVFDVFRDIEARMNEWKPDSPLTAVNEAAGQPIAVKTPADLRALLRRGLEIGALTGGAFDVSWAAMWRLWDFSAEAPRPPEASEITRRVALVDYRKVELDDAAGTVRLPVAGMKVGLGGIAKGWSLDRAAAALRDKGVKDFTLSAGGQIFAGGQKDGRPWRVGIRDPRGAPGDWFAVVQASDTSVSTSGDFVRFFVHDGVRYHHILDPRTGRPSQGLRSATVVTADATLADALSTALMVMGYARALALVSRLDGVECVLVDAQGKVHVSAGLSDRLVTRHPPRP